MIAVSRASGRIQNPAYRFVVFYANGREWGARMGTKRSICVYSIRQFAFTPFALIRVPNSREFAVTLFTLIRVPISRPFAFALFALIRVNILARIRVLKIGAD